MRKKVLIILGAFFSLFFLRNKNSLFFLFFLFHQKKTHSVNLKSIFRHLDATLPKFVARAFGCLAPAGSIYSINPAMIMTLVPIAGAALSWLEPFDAIHLGGYVSAASPLAIVASPTLGGTAGFVALLSIGEAVWSPRW